MAKTVKELRKCAYCEGSGVDPIAKGKSMHGELIRKECEVCKGEGVIRKEQNNAR